MMPFTKFPFLKRFERNWNMFAFFVFGTLGVLILSSTSVVAKQVSPFTMLEHFGCLYSHALAFILVSTWHAYGFQTVL